MVRAFEGLVREMAPGTPKLDSQAGNDDVQNREVRLNTALSDVFIKKRTFQVRRCARASAAGGEPWGRKVRLSSVKVPRPGR